MRHDTTRTNSGTTKKHNQLIKIFEIDRKISSFEGTFKSCKCAEIHHCAVEIVPWLSDTHTDITLSNVDNSSGNKQFIRVQRVTWTGLYAK